ncbi:penicillin-insensitive murein endopeptidase [Reyranella sp.]|uniref:penicillin-insensitive murein endopeptidase n=1 Tax=Reyranella sp. TaxID=1929291 RepID=UPI00272F3D92|nr:penicillin-insensitive murein endopeptidase [Reyranella sp.]MDP2378101.1 penicillin-insensitive murein endopeptidase [Reyranella sp.]
MGKVLPAVYPLNKMRRFVIPLLAAMFSTSAASAQEWGQVPGPSPGPTQAIGFYSAGCIQGAQALPTEGPGYEAIRLSRNRNWGHPVTLDFIRRFSDQARAAGQSHLYIGDIGQPRGGPMSFGHASHQVGLDVDIWFERQPGSRRAAADRENPRLRSLVRADDGGIDDAVFSDQHVALLRLAATSPGVDRIFVNKWIKERICNSTTGNRAWLRKLVPWIGHDEHFHVRLYCPPGSPQCQTQATYPDDDGCGEALDLWFKRPPVQMPPPGAPVKPYRPKLPAACQQVLNAP